MQRPRTGEIAVRNYPNEQELREFLLRHGGTWRPVPKSTPSFVCQISGRNRIPTDYPLSHGQADQGVTLDMPWSSSPSDDQSITLSEPPEGELSALADGTTGFFTVTARNVLGLESLQSRQISYATPPLGAHKLTVINGTGSGIYSEGTRVRVSANQPAADKQFDRWDYQILENPCSPVTTALMLFRDLTIEATYGAVRANGKFP